MEKTPFLFVFSLALVAGCGGERRDSKPNVVFILTDDQDVMLGGLTPMKNAKQMIRDQGVFFSNAFVHTPICCPSRSSYLTGNYIHNHGAINNTLEGNCASESWISGPEKRTYATFAKRAGYQTAYIGKYLNQYGFSKPGASGVKHIPEGWDRWLGLVGNSLYYNYNVSNQGVNEVHGDDYAKDYFTDLIANTSIEFIHTTAKEHPGAPFLLVAATPAPHYPFTPAPQYSHTYDGHNAPRTPNWNFHDPNRHWLVRSQPQMTEGVTNESDATFRDRWGTILSVDDLVGGVFKALQETGVEENTYVVFASDHGFQMGQFCIPSDKREPYEHDIRIPLMVKGPGIAKNVTLDQIVLNIDIAPTLIDLMGLEPPQEMDGTSFAPLLRGEAPSTWRHDFLIDYHGVGRWPCGLIICPPPAPAVFHPIDAGNNTYTCLRTLSSQENTIYCEFPLTGFAEYYDMHSDPWQLNNTVHDISAAVIQKQKTRLQQLRACSGPTCRT